MSFVDNKDKPFIFEEAIVEAATNLDRCGHHAPFEQKDSVFPGPQDPVSDR